MTTTTKPYTRSVELLEHELAAAHDGKLTQFWRPVTPQPPARFHTGDVAPLRNQRRPDEWAVGRLPASGKGEAWPPGSEPGFKCPFGREGDVVRASPRLAWTVGCVHLCRFFDVFEMDVLEMSGSRHHDGPSACCPLASARWDTDFARSLDTMADANPWLWHVALEPGPFPHK